MSALLFERSGNLLMSLFSAVYEKIHIHMKRKIMWSMYQIEKNRTCIYLKRQHVKSDLMKSQMCLTG